jgi:hypothetical protein
MNFEKYHHVREVFIHTISMIDEKAKCSQNTEYHFNN